MAKEKRSLMAGLASIGAVLFLALVAVIVIGYVRMPPETRDAFLGLYTGTHVAIDQAEYGSLRIRAEAALRPRGTPEEQAILQADKDNFRKQVDLFEAYQKGQLEQLGVIESQIRQQRESLSRDRAALDERRTAFEQEVRKGEKARQAVIVKKIRSLYRNMDAEDVAKDLLEQYREVQADRLAGDAKAAREKLDRIAAVLDQLPERFAAEVLTDMKAPSVRNEILKQIRERKQHGSLQ